MDDAATIPIYGVILAGGWGTRFWPLSRSLYPKQILRLLGSESMLQSTVERLLPRIPPARLAVVTNADQAGLIHQELQRQGWEKVRIWIEPEGRNTAAAVGLAAIYLGDEAEEAVMAVFPADHFIQDQAGLLRALDLGAAWAQAGYLVTFGIPPIRPGDRLRLHKVRQSPGCDRRSFPGGPVHRKAPPGPGPGVPGRRGLLLE